MLTLSNWLSIKKEVAYKLYVQLFKKLTAKKKFICEVIIKLAKDKLTADGLAAQGVMVVSPSTGKGLCSDKVRVFKATPPT